MQPDALTVSGTRSANTDYALSLPSFQHPRAGVKLEELMKTRLDKVLVERGLATSRERAQALILAGRVLVAEQKVEKPGTPVDDDVLLRLLGDDLRYVSRGGLKLERALAYWGVALAARACVDIGASTGGFTDCMLQHGARSVLAVDTGYGQIAHKLRVDERVCLMERCNARLLERGQLVGQLAGNREPGTAEARPAKDVEIDFLAMDVSFISATLVLPAAVWALAAADDAWLGEAVILIKPQFEAGREHVGKGGIVRGQQGQDIAITRVQECVAELGGTEIDLIDSPITGMEGNREYLLHAWFGNA